MSRRLRYFEPDGTPAKSEESELWRRLAATPTDKQDDPDTAPAEKDSKEDTTDRQSEDRFRIVETFDALNSAKAELMLLHGLVNQLETQASLGVTYLPDMRSVDDFHFHRHKQKLIKAEEKRQHMQEAASILQNINSTLQARVKTERTFYRELIGLSRFHTVRVQPTALSPFSVDLTLKGGWNVGLSEDPLVVDLYMDPSGHVSLSEDISQPTVTEVDGVMEEVEQHRDRVQKELKELESVEEMFIAEYRKQLESGETQKAESQRKRPSSVSDTANKRSKPQPERLSVPQKPVVKAPPLQEESSERESYMKKVISLDLDTEDEDLLVSSEEGVSDSASEDNMPAVTVNAPLMEEGFNREELHSMTKVHLALCGMQVENLWKHCKKVLRAQASRAHIRPHEHLQFHQAVEQLEGTEPSIRVLRTELLTHFVNSVYKLPPFLYQIDIRDLSLTAKEKLMLLTKAPGNQNDEDESAEKEAPMPAMHEEDEDWMTRMPLNQFLKYRFREAAPRLDSLLVSFLQTLKFQTLMKQTIAPALASFPELQLQSCRTPGVAHARFILKLPGRFYGELFIDASGIALEGEFRDRSHRRLRRLQLHGESLDTILAALTD